MKQGDETLLQVGVQVNEQIATANERKFRERGIFDDIQFGKDEQIADDFMNAIRAA